MKEKHNIDPGQKKISNMFRPVMKKTSSTVDQVTSNIDIYMKDNNLEDDPDIKDNPGCPTNKPIMKTTSNMVDQLPSHIDICLKENNFEDDLKFEYNLGCTTDRQKLEASRPPRNSLRGSFWKSF